MAGCSSFADWKMRSFTPGPSAATRACRAGRAIANRFPSSLPESSPSFGKRRLVDSRARAAASLRDWLMATFDLAYGPAAVLTDLFEAQAQWSEVPDASGLLVEEAPSPDGDGVTYTFHAPLHRAACEALGRASAARLGRRFGRNLGLSVADLGWSIRIDADACADGLEPDQIGPLLDLERFADDVLEGLDRGELPARRFQQVAATGLMVLRNSEPGRRVRVGGMNWVSKRLYPLVKAACPDHPLLRETRREVLEDLLDVPAAEALAQRAAGDTVPFIARPIAVRRGLDRARTARLARIRAAR